MIFDTTNAIRKKTREELIDEFFSKRMKWSFSSLTTLLFSPRVFFKDYILKEKDKSKKKHFSEGSLIHALILEPDVLPEKYVIQPMAVPKDNQLLIVEDAYAQFLLNQGTSADAVQFSEFGSTILAKMRDLKYFQQLTDDKPTKAVPIGKTGDEKRLEKVMTPENIAYFNFLKTASGKTLVSEETYTYCLKAAEYVKENKKCATLLGLYPEFLGNSEIINEQFIEIDPTEEEEGYKGFLDSTHIDHDVMAIYINEIKTTSKPLDRFYRTVMDYLYSIQAAIYRKLVEYKYADLIEQGYEVKMHFIVIDANLQVYAFPVKEETMFRWNEELYQAIKKAKWHISERSVALPYNYELNLVEL